MADSEVPGINGMVGPLLPHPNGSGTYWRINENFEVHLNFFN
jgi:hypothetical protein